MALPVCETNPAPSEAVNFRVIGISLAFTVAIAALMIAIAFTTGSADASTYTSSAGGNWTGGLTWICAPGAPGSLTCGPYPGSSTVNGDIANVNNASYTVNTAIPGAVTLNMINNPQTVDVATSGVLGLTGSSAVTSTSGVNVLSISGGTLSNTGTVTVGSGGSLNFNGGTLNGAGTTTIAGGTLNFTGSQGPMAINPQTVNIGSTANFNGGTLTLTGSTITNSGTFNANSGTIASGGGGQFVNTGTVTDSVGPFTINTPFINTNGSVNVTGTTLSLLGGTGTGSDSGGTWALANAVTGAPATLALGSFHSFIGTPTFIGLGTIQVNSGGGLTVNTASMSIPGGINVINNGTVGFGSSGQTLSLGGNYTQSATGSLNVFIGPPPTTDLLTVSGNSNLAGALTASAAYAPSNGDTFTVFKTLGTRAGDFSPKNLPSYAGGTFVASYSGTAPESLQLIAVPTDVDISIAKTGPATAAATSPLTYTVTVTNNGPASATNLTVTDTLPAGVTSPAASGPFWTCGISGNIVTCTWPSTAVAPLAPGQSAPAITITANAPATAGPITNSATATSPANDPNGANNTANVTTTITAVSDLGITKTGPANATAGQNVTYTISVTNSGPSAASGVTVNDPTPAGLTFVSNSGSCTTPFPCSLGTVAAGPGGPTITSTYQVASSATGTITNTATVSSSGTDPNPGNDSFAATTAVGASADLGITKALTSTLTAGSNATYSIVVTNNGPSDATGVTVTDPTPAGMTFVSNSGACTTTFPCAIGTLTAGSSATITTTFAVASTATGSISNTAAVSATTPDPNALNDSSTATGTIGTNADLQITKTGPATANPGQPYTFLITVVNNGPSSATGVAVQDATPAGMTFVSNTGACTTAFPCAIGTLAAGASASIASTYTVAATATGTISNTATVSSTSTDPVATNNSSTATTTVASKADLSITKSGPATIPSSGLITFTINVKNIGPAAANNVVVNDSPGPGLTFVSNAGGCTTPFPCTFATLAAGGSISIQSTFKAAAGASKVTNTADVTSSTPDPNNANNAMTVSVGGVVSTCPSGTLSQFIPFSGQQDAPTAGQIQWTNVGASSYEVYLGPAGQGCTTLVATVNGTGFAYSGLASNTDYESRIVAVEPGCPSISSQCIRWKTVSGGCNLAAPQLQSPAAGTTVGGTTRLQWSAVTGAASYHVVVTVNGVTSTDTTTTDTFLDVTVPDGKATWSVTAVNGNCTGPTSTGAFNSCGPPLAPVAGVVGAPSSGNTYSVIVINPPSNALSYEYQEATDASFSNVISQTTNATFEQYTHTANVPEVFFYRVRATGACTNTSSPFSKTIRVVIVPNLVNLRNPNINVPAGNKNLVVIQVQIPGDAVKENFAATADRPWIVRIDPSSGILPPEGIILNVTIDPAQLPNGTFTATVIVATSPISPSGRLVTNGSAKSVPVSINLVTPVVPVNPNAPTADSIFIPAVGHLAGLNSQWRSDIRIYNASPQTLQYVLKFTAQGSTDVKQTTITTASGDTTALDDIIHNWFGVGEVGDSSTGVLEIRPMGLDGSTTPPQGGSFTTVASSRTFDTTGDGTVGQFIPPVKFTNFIGNGSRLSMQQLAQSQAYRTNFGLLEGSGSPVSLMLSMFNSAGTKLFDLPVNLAGGEQKLLNGLLTQQGVSSLSDGRMEVKVASGAGKVTAYASVIDNASLDPQLVPGQNLTNTSSKLYVVPGVADLNNGVANWRTDMRIYNSGGAPSTTELVFYPQDNAGVPFFATVTVNPGEVKVLDSVLQSLFATHDVGGMVQLTTATDSQLVVTARTFNQTSNGTLGQFISAATSAEGITTNTKSLNILQVEDSPRFRTNLGIAEMTGKPATVEVSVILPDSKVTPSIQVPLGANEFRQFSVGQFGLGNIYNARVSVKVIDGAGSVTAYGSVIDQITSDPTYVKAQ